MASQTATERDACGASAAPAERSARPAMMDPGSETETMATTHPRSKAPVPAIPPSLRDRLGDVVAVAAERASVAVARLARRRRSAILAYHGVDELSHDEDPELLCIEPDRFREHLKVLVDAGYEFVTVRDFVARGGEPGLIAISFDDGLANLRTVALPILRDYGISATVYVPTGLIGRAYPWTANDSGVRIMDGEDIRALAEAGFEIGAHTVNHRDLSTCSYEESLTEMVESRRILERLSGSAVETFAYPYALYSPDAERAARDAGFSAAVSYSIHAHPGDQFALSRELVTPQHGPVSLVLKVLGLYDRLSTSPPGRIVRLLTRPVRRRPEAPLKPRV